MNDKVAEKLAALADKLGVAVDVLWSALLRQARIEGIYYLCLTVCILTVLVVGTIWGVRKLPKLNYDSDSDMTTVVIGVVIGIGLLIVAICCLICLPNVLAGVFNPEYWALHELIAR